MTAPPTGGAFALWGGGPPRVERPVSAAEEQVFINNHQRLEEEDEAGLLAEVFNGNFPDREPWDACGVTDKRCRVVASG